MESRGFEEMGRGWGWADTDDATEAGHAIGGTRSANKKAELGGFLFCTMSPLPSGSVFFATSAHFRG